MNTGAFFPLLGSIDSNLYRKRAQNYPKLPSVISELMILDGNDRLLMFASDWSVRFLGACSQ